MLTLHVDLGQVIIAALIAAVGYFMKRTLERFDRRLDRHDEMFLSVFAALGIVHHPLKDTPLIERRLTPRSR